MSLIISIIISIIVIIILLNWFKISQEKKSASIRRVLGKENGSCPPS